MTRWYMSARHVQIRVAQCPSVHLVRTKSKQAPDGQSSAGRPIWQVALNSLTMRSPQHDDAAEDVAAGFEPVCMSMRMAVGRGCEISVARHLQGALVVASSENRISVRLDVPW